MVSRINGDLANDFGNLVQRVLSMVARNCAAQTPEPGPLAPEDRALLDRAGGLAGAMRVEIDSQAIHKALILLWAEIGEANRYVDACAPWELKRFDPARMRTVLYVLAEAIRHYAILNQLGVGEGRRSFAQVGESGALEPGTPLPEPEAVFPRFVETPEGVVG
jgi:methionyl-tRNA synthetase